MKKPLTIIGITMLIAGIIFFKSIPVEATVTNFCDSAHIAQVFTSNIMTHSNLFISSSFDEDALKEALGTTDNDNIIYKYIKGNDVFIETPEKYHKTQEELFKKSISYSLKDLDKKSSKTLDVVISENPILWLYKKKLESMKNNNTELTEAIPTFIVGLEATLNYTIFSCNYIVNEDDVVKKSSGLQDSLVTINFSIQEKGRELLEAKRILEYALNSYDSLAIAYPQHQAYLKTIKELKKLRELFGNMEDITSSCVLKNHYYSSCK